VIEPLAFEVLGHGLFLLGCGIYAIGWWLWRRLRRRRRQALGRDLRRPAPSQETR